MTEDTNFKFVATKEDIDWTISIWKDVWKKQNKLYVSDKILDTVTGVSVSIHEFIDGFVILSGLGGDWKHEMETFRDIVIEHIEEKEKEATVQTFFDDLNKVDWQRMILTDTQDNTHKYVCSSDYQVVTESNGSYFVWDKSTADCMIRGCEEFRISGKL